MIGVATCGSRRHRKLIGIAGSRSVVTRSGHLVPRFEGTGRDRACDTSRKILSCGASGGPAAFQTLTAFPNGAPIPGKVIILAGSTTFLAVVVVV
jgi:hypothetical protein